jgi:hypothetical protein
MKGRIDCPKNPDRHSAAGEESHIFLLKSKNQKMRSFGLRPQDDKERSNGVILSDSEESPYLFLKNIKT